MTKGIRAYELKKRREIRRRNHIAYDLGSPKYRQRIIPSKRKMKEVEADDWFDDEGFY